MDINELAELNAFQLASRADCSTPDSFTSAGATFLTHVRDRVVEAIEGFDGDGKPDYDDIYGHEIADGAPDVYTYTRWAEFVDLGAYNEDPTELGWEDGDMTAAAGICLYLIAQRLVSALLDEYEIPESDDDDDEAGS